MIEIAGFFACVEAEAGGVKERNDTIRSSQSLDYECGVTVEPLSDQGLSVFAFSCAVSCAVYIQKCVILTQKDVLSVLKNIFEIRVITRKPRCLRGCSIMEAAGIEPVLDNVSA